MTNKEIKLFYTKKYDSLPDTFSKSVKGSIASNYIARLQKVMEEKGVGPYTAQVYIDNEDSKIVKNDMSKRNKKHKVQQYNETSADKLKNYKIFVVGQSYYGSWTNMQLVDSVEDADLVMFTGGEDVDPSYYNEEMGEHTYSNISRDKKEVKIWEQAVALNKKIIGICRGAQLACVMSGGKLIQHCTDHNNNDHVIIGCWGKKDVEMIIPGDHHQMMYPYDMPLTDYRIIGYSKDRQSEYYLDGNDNRILVPKCFVEPEIMVFTRTNALAIQGHPEWDKEGSEDVKILQDLLLTFIKIKEFKLVEHGAIA